MTLTVLNAIKKVVIFKNGKRYCLEIYMLLINVITSCVYVSTAPDLFPLLDVTLESENPALNRVVQVTLPEWFVILLFSKGMPAA
jgi:hypothetical protein